jgi:hypothetical protein
MFDDLIGVLHLIEATLSNLIVKPLITPVFAHFGMHKILVDRGQIRGQYLVQQIDDTLFRLHNSLLSPQAPDVRRDAEPVPLFTPIS